MTRRPPFIEDSDEFPISEQQILPSDPKKLRTKLRNWERTLEKEKERFGDYGDGYGKRFMLGPFYMILGDLEGALRSFVWFSDNFGDDNGDASQYACWALALHRTADEAGAKRKLRQVMFSNIYLIPALLGKEIKIHDIWHGSNLEVPSHINWIPDEYFDLWSEDELKWLESCWQSDEFRQIHETIIELGRKIKYLSRGFERSQALDALYELRHK